ncbi:MAG: ABC transporter substrate-binding protein [Anaerolineae bacterium]
MRRNMPAFVAVGIVLALSLSACEPAATPAAVEVTREVVKEVTQEVEVTKIVREEVEVRPVPEGPYEYLARARVGEFAGEKVNIFGVYTAADAKAFEAALAPFRAATDIEVEFEGSPDFETLITTRVEGGNPPDIALFSQPGLVREFARQGHLVDLSSFIPVDKVEEDFNESWIDLGKVDDSLYGIFYRASTKSIVWYPVQPWEEAGYEIPETWDDLIALSDQIVEDGGAPWCISIEHGDATGWVVTDWIEDVLLRIAEPEIYDQWVNHEIPFDNEHVREAMDYVADIWFTEGYVPGGRETILSMWVGDTPKPMFDDPPTCWMHKQAGWISAFFPEGKDAGEDAMFFYLPPIDEELGKPVLGAGDLFAMFNDRPEVRAMMEYLSTPAAAEVWVKTGGFIPANRSVPLDWYPDPVDQKQAEILQNATTVRFDASDNMPAQVGTGTFWSGMVEWVADEKDADTVLEEIDNSWPED